MRDYLFVLRYHLQAFVYVDFSWGIMCIFVVFEWLYNHVFYFYIDLIKMYQMISNVNSTINFQQNIENRDEINYVEKFYLYTILV